MKLPLFFGLMLALAALVSPLSAEDETGGDAAVDKASSKLLGFLSPVDQEHFTEIRKRVMDNNPDLRKEGIKLLRQSKTLKGPDVAPEDKLEYIENWLAYQQKLREAMLKSDPTLQPIFDQIDQKMSQMRAKMTGGGGATPAPVTNPAPVTPAPPTPPPAR